MFFYPGKNPTKDSRERVRPQHGGVRRSRRGLISRRSTLRTIQPRGDGNIPCLHHEAFGEAVSLRASAWQSIITKFVLGINCVYGFPRSPFGLPRNDIVLFDVQRFQHGLVLPPWGSLRSKRGVIWCFCSYERLGHDFSTLPGALRHPAPGGESKGCARATAHGEFFYSPLGRQDSQTHH